MNRSNEQSRYRLHPNAAAEALGDELLLIHLGQGTTYRLNRSGKRIWDFVCSGLRVDEVSRQLQTHYSLPATQAGEDVRILLAELLHHQLLEEVRENAA